MPYDSIEDERLEREALGKVVLAFRRYQQDANVEVRDGIRNPDDLVDRWLFNLKQLPTHQQMLLVPHKRKCETARQCIYNNQFFLSSMLASFDPDPDDPESGGPSMLMGGNAAADELEQQGYVPSPAEMDKVRYVLKNLVRDWSAEGAAEREISYGRIVTELQQLFKDWESQGKERPRVMCPGTGLARLCCEIAGAGFEVQGNEFAYFMLLTSSFVLNTLVEPEQYTVFPFVTQPCNNVTDADQLRGVAIPDVCPAEIVGKAGVPGLLSMAAGDFIEVYSRPENESAWDCVVTCFFIDTAHNIVQYLEVIRYCLKPGGYWINIGPLLYHWAEGYGLSELSLELSLEEIKHVSKALGMTVVREDTVHAPYIGNSQSMFQTEYKAPFFTMQKTGNPVIPIPHPAAYLQHSAHMYNMNPEQQLHQHHVQHQQQHHHGHHHSHSHDHAGGHCSHSHDAPVHAHSHAAMSGHAKKAGNAPGNARASSSQSTQQASHSSDQGGEASSQQSGGNNKKKGKKKK